MNLSREIKSMIFIIKKDVRYYMKCCIVSHKFDDVTTIIENNEKKLLCSRCYRTVPIQELIEVVSHE